MGIVSAGMTHIGRKRKSNQDAIYLNSKNHLYIVADGVGGHSGGDVASTMAVSLIPDYFLKQDINENNVKEHLVEAINYTNRAILNESMKRPELQGMGTTVVAMYFLEGNLYIVNIGDSRSYLVHEGQLYQLTQDHSLVQEKINLGFYTREQAREDPMRNVLVRTVGHEESTRADIFSYKVSPNDCFLLCSDGLHDKVNDQDVLTLINQHISQGKCSKSQLQSTVEALIDQANKNGGGDNISVIISMAQ